MVIFPSFHCLFCHGFEDRGCASAGVLAVGDCAAVGPAMQMARMARQLAGRVRVYVDGNADLARQLEEPAAAAGFAVEVRRIEKLSKRPEASQVLVSLDGGDEIVEGFLVRGS